MNSISTGSGLNFLKKHFMTKLKIKHSGKGCSSSRWLMTLKEASVLCCWFDKTMSAVVVSSATIDHGLENSL